MDLSSFHKPMIRRYAEFCQEYGTIENSTYQIWKRRSDFMQHMSRDHGISCYSESDNLEILGIQDMQRATMFKLRYG